MGYFITNYISQLDGERIFKIGEHMAKLQAKCLTVSYSPFALHVRPQRCRTRQISKILVCNEQKLLLIVAMLIDRLM